MRIQLNRSRDEEEGVVAVFVAILAVTLIVVAAFTTDFGMVYAQRQALSTGADSAALAVARAKYITEMGPSHPSCDELVAQDAGEAKTIAMQNINANKPFNVASDPTDVTVALVCDSTSKTLQVTVKIDRTIDSIFGKVVGVASMHVDRTAMAALGVANTVTGVEPFGMCVNQARDIVSNKGTQNTTTQLYPAQIVKETKVWTGPTTTQCDSGGAGNWGWLGLPGMGNNSNGLGDMLATGYDGAVAIGDIIEVVPGGRANNSHTKGAMADLMNTTVTFPVFDAITGNGDGTKFRIYGFITVRLCGYDKTITTGTHGTCYDSSTNPMVDNNDMQVRFVASTLEGGQIGGLCNIGETTCAFNAYTTKLQRVDGSP